MKYTFLDSSALRDVDFSFWQSELWQKILLSSGQAREVFYFWDIAGTFLLLEIRSLHFGLYGAFALGVTRNQVWADFQEYLIALKAALKKKGVVFLQIEPLEPLETDFMYQEKPFYYIGDYRRSKYYKAFLMPCTRIIRLTWLQSTGDILDQMNEKWRYNLRLAEKRGVTIERVPPTDENIDVWMRLLSDTLSRDNFSGNSRKYYESFLRVSQDDDTRGHPRMYFAFWEWRVVAAWLFMFTPKRAIYYYGASSSRPEERKQMASYLLQWFALQDAHAAWIAIYDFLWVSDPEKPDAHLLWVTAFKDRFGWELYRLPNKMYFPLSWKGTWLVRLKRLIRRSGISI